MNFIHLLHGNSQPHNHHRDARSANAPFWVRYYDQVVNLVTWGRTKRIHQQTIALANIQPHDDILDIGCGTGILLMEAEKTAGQGNLVVGLDVEPEMIRQAQQRALKKQSRANFEVASIDQIPYAANTFDVVTSSLMYHHLTEAQRSAGLGELYRVLKTNGRLLIVDLNPQRHSLATRLPGHNQLDRQDYVRTEVAERMKAAGFTIIDAGAHPAKQLSYALGKKS